MTVSEKRGTLSRKIQKSEFLVLVGRFNSPLCCVKILKEKTLNTRRDSQLNLPYSSRAIRGYETNLQQEVSCRLDMALIKLEPIHSC